MGVCRRVEVQKVHFLGLKGPFLRGPAQSWLPQIFMNSSGLKDNNKNSLHCNRFVSHIVPVVHVDLAKHMCDCTW